MDCVLRADLVGGYRAGQSAAITRQAFSTTCGECVSRAPETLFRVAHRLTCTAEKAANWGGLLVRIALLVGAAFYLLAAAGALKRLPLECIAVIGMGRAASHVHRLPAIGALRLVVGTE
jgi:hypothetical protein